MKTGRLRAQGGISLIEAIVALGVMAFGMLALVGVQTTLRGSSDLARQRTEAMRIAQETMEGYRAYAALSGSAGLLDFSEIVSAGRTAVVATGALDGRLNTTFHRTIDAPLQANSALMRPVAVTVDWTDRNGGFQTVELRSLIAGGPPELAGSLALPPSREPFSGPRGRHRHVPAAAFSPTGVGLSIFKPPQGAGGTSAWVFNNVTGLVVGLCDVSASVTNDTFDEAQALSCISSANATSAQLVTGYLQFAEGDPSLNAQAEQPTGGTRNLDMVLSLTSDGHPSPASICFDDATDDALTAAARREVTYYCLVFSNTAGTWAGRTRVLPQAFNSGAPWTIAGSGTAFKVCRYTPLDTDTGTRNVDHPLDYTQAGSPRGTGLANQNFLVIGADFACPAETPGPDDLFNANTRLHQDGIAPYTNP